jgi:hypothetical protein
MDNGLTFTEEELNDLDYDTIDFLHNVKVVKNPTIVDIKKILNSHSAKLLQWDNDKVLLDTTTANCLITCYNSLSQDNKIKFNRMIGKNKINFIKVVDICWSVVK